MTNIENKYIYKKKNKKNKKIQSLKTHKRFFMALACWQKSSHTSL